MASAKEIRTKIKSVQSTQKITKAMEMVAASKMRRAKDRMSATRPYAQKIREVVGHVAAANTEYVHPYMRPREDVKRIGYIVVSSDRGLCGGLNINNFKVAVASMREWSEKGVEIEVCTIGKKASSFFTRLGSNIVADVVDLGDQPKLEDLIGSVTVMLNGIAEGRLDRLFLAENEFVNSMTQAPRLTQLIPTEADTDDRLGSHWDYLYEPSSEEVLDQLMRRYIESLIFQAAVENVACEMAARMVAMKSATDNAGDIINDLQLVYNKARQAAITQEISEIVGGAAAV